jgi:hypothetical protein
MIPFMVIKNTCTGSLKVVLFTENIVTVSFIGEETGVPGENHQPNRTVNGNLFVTIQR